MAVDLVPAEVEGRPVLGCDLVDMPRLRELTAGRAIAAIVHCGAMSGPNVGRNSPLQQVSVNIVGTANMLELGRELGVSRFVYASSVSAYGDCQGENLDEQTPLRPTNVYGATKAASEMLVMAYAADFRIRAVSPKVGERGVATDSKIAVRFTRAFDPRTVSAEAVGLGYLYPSVAIDPENPTVPAGCQVEVDVEGAWVGEVR